jgi:hypothetical protein
VKTLEMRRLLEETPAQVKHCVRKVGKKYGDTSRAFAICVAAGQKRGTLKPGTMEPTAKGKKADIAKKKEPGHGAAVTDYEKLLVKARKKRSEDVMPSLRTNMLQLLGETEKDDFQTRRDAGPTSTGVTNKTPGKKTPPDNVKPPNVTKSGDTGTPSATASPKNSPAKAKPMKAGIAPPNVKGAVENAVDDMKRLARIYAGIDSKYELGDGGNASPDEEPQGYLASLGESVESDDPILKHALEGKRSGKLFHPFE